MHLMCILDLPVMMRDLLRSNHEASKKRLQMCMPGLDLEAAGTRETV